MLDSNPFARDEDREFLAADVVCTDRRPFANVAESHRVRRGAEPEVSAEEEAIQDVVRMSERWYARLSTILDHTFEERQPVVMYATHPHFQQTNIVGSISEGTGGVTEAFKQRVVMPFSYSYEETDHVLGHELVHAFQYDISGLGRAGGGIEAAARRFQVPLWFIEGMAEYLSVGPVDPHTAMWLRDGALRGDIPTIDRMTNDRLAELADDAPTGGAPAAELWARGKRA